MRLKERFVELSDRIEDTDLGEDNKQTKNPAVLKVHRRIASIIHNGRYLEQPKPGFLKPN